jgi:carboxymethylenebutenolidase
MRFHCLAFILLCALNTFAATAKSVSYKSGDDTVQALIYTPEGKGPFPGILVIHEYWGLNDWVKEQASKLSDLGYVALAVDLYRGKVATTPDEAHEIMRGVPDDRAARDLHAAFEFLKSQPNVKKDRIASIGWCMGGGYSFNVALQEPTLTADVINSATWQLIPSYSRKSMPRFWESSEARIAVSQWKMSRSLSKP